ncbi:MAG: DUF3572 family protein [Hyphomicrobiaceae bacterium]
MRDRHRPREMTRDSAEELGARALLFLVEDSGRLVRFLADTGLDPAELRHNMQDAATLAAAIGHLMADESSLLAFASNVGVEPDDIARAELALGGGAHWEST